MSFYFVNYNTIYFSPVSGAMDDAHSEPASCGKYASHGAAVKTAVS